MSEFGVTPEGFSIKRLPDILEDKNQALKSVLGENVNISPDSPDGQVNGIYSESDANLWALAEICYNAFNPSSATQTTLSNLVQLNGIRRLKATNSSVTLTFTGDNGSVIPTNTKVSTDPVSGINVQFSTTEEVTISAGTADVLAKCIDTGPIEASAGTLTVIDTPLSGNLSVTNALDADLGTNQETDVELRVRRENSVAKAASAVIDSIAAEVGNIDGVTSVNVLENDTNAVDSNGLPAHSFNVIVSGGLDADVAQGIFVKKPIGIEAFGTTTVQVLDDQDNPHDIGFSRPTLIPIYIIVDLTIDSNYPANGDDLIKQAIIDYAEGNLVQGREFRVGDDVIQSRLFTPVNLAASGHDIDSILIGTSPSPTLENNITIDIDEISSFDIANITVNS